MDTEGTTPSGSKNFFIIALVAVLVVAGVIGYRYYYGRVSIDGKFQELPSTLLPRELTEEEKLLRFQVEALDNLRAEYQIQSPPQSTTTPQSQVKSLDAIRVKQKTTGTATKKTLEQQIQELDALRASTLNK